MTVEQDQPGQVDTFKRFIWDRTKALRYVRAFFARRFVGMIGIFTDSMAEATQQSIYARFPGHPHQAHDSLEQVALDRDFFRFRGETWQNFAARVLNAWEAYEQGGTDINLLRVIDQWGTAGWPLTWVNGTCTITESADPAVFTFTLDVPFGLIDPPWQPWTWGSGHTWGEIGLYWGIGGYDIPMLLYLVNKWKPARSRAYVRVHWGSGPSEYITFTV